MIFVPSWKQFTPPGQRQQLHQLHIEEQDYCSDFLAIEDADSQYRNRSSFHGSL
jgi:hypothetical protein